MCSTAVVSGLVKVVVSSDCSVVDSQLLPRFERDPGSGASTVHSDTFPWQSNRPLSVGGLLAGVCGVLALADVQLKNGSSSGSLPQANFAVPLPLAATSHSSPVGRRNPSLSSLMFESGGVVKHCQDSSLPRYCLVSQRQICVASFQLRWLAAGSSVVLAAV